MTDTSGVHWSRFDVTDWELAGEEPQGLQPHPWLRHASQNRPWLFKAAEWHPDRTLSDDVVEKMASEIAHAIGVPAATVELVVRGGTWGCVVETLRPSGWVFQAGQVLLAGAVNDYDPADPTHRGYNIENVRRALDGFGPSPNVPSTAGLNAFDVFTGFLLYDALIANTDRHDRNWAVLEPPPGLDVPYALCGSYDHASSLGFNVSDAVREREIRHATVRRWAARAPARQFEHGARRRRLIDVAREAVELCSVQARHHWLRAFASVGDGQLGEIVGRAPELTPVTRHFTLALLQINREYLPRASTVSGFRPLIGFPRLDEVYEADRLWPFFALRGWTGAGPTSTGSA